MVKYLPVVHIVDTEGTLEEPLKTTFKRVYGLFGLKIKPTKSNLKKILNKHMNLPLNTSLKKAFYKAFNKNVLNYNSTWKKIDEQSRLPK